MAVYRSIHISFWQDTFVLNLTPEEKYFYLYLMTNSKTKQCGIYELTKKVICFETGYNMETIEKLIERFEKYGKIIYDVGTSEIFIVNWLKHNPPDNRNIIKCIEKELNTIKSKVLLNKYFGINETHYEPLTNPLQEVCEPLPSNNNNNNNNNNKNNNNIISSEPFQGSEQVVIELPTNRYSTTQETFNLGTKLFSDLANCYPAVDIMNELNKMRAWLLTNSNRRKTKNGMTKFINNWLSNSQDKGGNNANNKPANNGNPRFQTLRIDELNQEVRDNWDTIYADATKHCGNNWSSDVGKQS